MINPKGSSYRTPHNKIKILVKEAKQMVNGPYWCPKCRKELMQILADKNNREVLAICKCGVEQKLTYAPIFQPIDYYSKFMDMWRKGKCTQQQQQPKP